MLLKKLSLPVMACLLAVATLTTNQAYALNDDEAAVLVGLAVGGLAAYAVKHHREHDRRDWEYSERRRYHHYDGGHDRDYRYRDRHYNHHSRKHHHDRHCGHNKHRNRPHKVEHYVIHNPPSHKHRKHHDSHGRRGHYPAGYDYEYEYHKKKMRF